VWIDLLARSGCAPKKNLAPENLLSSAKETSRNDLIIKLLLKECAFMNGISGVLFCGSFNGKRKLLFVFTLALRIVKLMKELLNEETHC
jgi:hypothetical protein